MGRPPKILDAGTRGVNARVTIPTSVWNLSEAVGKYFYPKDHTPALKGMWYLLEKIGDLVSAGDVRWIADPLFQRLLDQLRDANHGIVDQLEPIDLGRLHTSTKLKSGYYGVYAEGYGYKAMGRTLMGGIKKIGLFKTAEEAAYRRYLYYTSHKFPYGEIEIEMDRLRRGHPQFARASDEVVINEIRTHSEFNGTDHQIFGPYSATVIPKFEPGTDTTPPDPMELSLEKHFSKLIEEAKIRGKAKIPGPRVIYRAPTKEDAERALKQALPEPEKPEPEKPKLVDPHEPQPAANMAEVLKYGFWSSPEVRKRIDAKEARRAAKEAAAAQQSAGKAEMHDAIEAAQAKALAELEDSIDDHRSSRRHVRDGSDEIKPDETP